MTQNITTTAAAILNLDITAENHVLFVSYGEMLAGLYRAEGETYAADRIEHLVECIRADRSRDDDAHYASMDALVDFVSLPDDEDEAAPVLVCVSPRYCRTREEFESVEDFQAMCQDCFGVEARLSPTHLGYRDETGELVLEWA